MWFIQDSRCKPLFRASPQIRQLHPLYCFFFSCPFPFCFCALRKSSRGLYNSFPLTANLDAKRALRKRQSKRDVGDELKYNFNESGTSRSAWLLWTPLTTMPTTTSELQPDEKRQIDIARGAILGVYLFALMVCLGRVSELLILVESSHSRPPTGGLTPRR